MMFEAEDVVKWFLKMSQKTNEQMEFLTALDEEIGDGDHGLNMAQGFRAVHNQLQRDSFQLRTVGRATDERRRRGVDGRIKRFGGCSLCDGIFKDGQSVSR